MTNQIPPALTAEEWKEGHLGRPGFIRDGTHALLAENTVRITAMDDDGTDVDGIDRHALAALCLYSQPFGFTHYEANILETIVPVIEQLDRHGDGNRDPVLLGIIAKIRALLPPREDT